MITGDNDIVQYHDEEGKKLNSGAHALTLCKIIKSPFNKNNVTTIKSN